MKTDVRTRCTGYKVDTFRSREETGKTGSRIRLLRRGDGENDSYGHFICFFVVSLYPCVFILMYTRDCVF